MARNRKKRYQINITDEKATALLDWYLNGRSGATNIVTIAVIEHLTRLKQFYQGSLAPVAEEVNQSIPE